MRNTNNSITSITRRTFVRASAATALTAAEYRRVWGANERVGVGFIGFGLIGERHVLDFKDLPDVDPIAVAETHSGRLNEAKSTIGGHVEGYGDFRRLLDRKDVDAVIVSTPDHWHALLTMLACEAGKDVYVEKPLTLFVKEGRWMTDVAQRTNRVVQVGTQQRSGPHYQRARDLIRDGRLGDVVGVRMASYRNIMPGFGSPADCDPPPELDWDLWLGPAPKRKYNPNRGIYHFRWFWDTSGGQMTNLGQHSLDIVHWFLGLHAPKSVTSIGGKFALKDNGETPDTQEAIFEYPNLVVQWSHREAAHGTEPNSILEFQGTKGSMIISRAGFQIIADRKVDPSRSLPRFAEDHPVGSPSQGPRQTGGEFWTEALVDRSGDSFDQFRRHARGFLDSVKSRKPPVSDLEGAHRVVTACHLANLSLRLGRRLQWDADRETVVNDPQAKAMLERPYRTPWDKELDRLVKR